MDSCCRCGRKSAQTKNGLLPRQAITLSGAHTHFFCCTRERYCRFGRVDSGANSVEHYYPKIRSQPTLFSASHQADDTQRTPYLPKDRLHAGTAAALEPNSAIEPTGIDPGLGVGVGAVRRSRPRESSDTCFRAVFYARGRPPPLVGFMQGRHNFSANTGACREHKDVCSILAKR